MLPDEAKKIPRIPFYFIRHGQTDANLQELMCGGGWDIDINETGRGQAQAAAEKLREKARDIQTLVASSMIRAQSTAKILNAQLQKPLLSSDELKEWHVGAWEKRPWGEVPNPFVSEIDPPAGESRRAFELRVEAGVAAALKQPGPVLIVAHGAVAHALFTLMDHDRDLIDNCSAYRFIPRADSVAWDIEQI